MTAQRGDAATTAVCTCGPGVLGTCDICGDDAWVNHRCPFPCDDVTCDNRLVCMGCLTGRPCAVHNDTEVDW